jgi:hypothetical protein
MARKRNREARTNSAVLPLLRPNAAGVDIGATEVYAAVPAERCAEPVRSFPTFTQDLYALADWFEPCGIKTVAMESTGVYWIPLFQILEARGFEVCLVNTRHVKNVPGRRTDVSDCQWLQFLHSVGLLKASYRPEQEVCAVRSLLRHRESLVQMARILAVRNGFKCTVLFSMDTREGTINPNAASRFAAGPGYSERLMRNRSSPMPSDQPPRLNMPWTVPGASRP